MPSIFGSVCTCRYQKASLAGEASAAYKQFNAAEWVLEELNGRPMNSTQISAQRVHGLELPGAAGSALRLLDVGAIVNHYPAEDASASAPDDDPAKDNDDDDNDNEGLLRPGEVRGPVVSVDGAGPRRLHVTSIDLNPRDKDVLKADFLEWAKDQVAARISYDVIVLSLVINFVGSPVKRGEMLQLCGQLLVEGGLLFLVTPEPCVYNSRYLKFKLFSDMLSSCGMPIIPGGWKVRALPLPRMCSPAAQ